MIWIQTLSWKKYIRPLHNPQIITELWAPVERHFPVRVAPQTIESTGTTHEHGSINTTSIHTTWQATTGPCGQHQALPVIINDCGQIEQAEPTSVHFTPAWHGGGLGTPERRLPPFSAPFEAHQRLGFLLLIFWNKLPWRPNLRFFFFFSSHLPLRSDVGFFFVLVIPASVDLFHWHYTVVLKAITWCKNQINMTECCWICCYISDRVHPCNVPERGVTGLLSKMSYSHKLCESFFEMLLGSFVQSNMKFWLVRY